MSNGCNGAPCRQEVPTMKQEPRLEQPRLAARLTGCGTFRVYSLEVYFEYFGLARTYLLTSRKDKQKSLNQHKHRLRYCIDIDIS